MKNKKPDNFTKRFIEWSSFHGCPIMIEKEDGTWESTRVKKFDWVKHNYRIENDHYKQYYLRLYAHGRM